MPSSESSTERLPLEPLKERVLRPRLSLSMPDVGTAVYAFDEDGDGRSAEAAFFRSEPSFDLSWLVLLLGSFGDDEGLLTPALWALEEEATLRKELVEGMVVVRYGEVLKAGSQLGMILKQIPPIFGATPKCCAARRGISPVRSRQGGGAC